MGDLYVKPCSECAGCFMVGVFYPVSLGTGGSGELGYVVACDCLEYDSDGMAGEALAEKLGSLLSEAGAYRAETWEGGVVLLDSDGAPLTIVRALGLLESASANEIDVAEMLSESSSSSSASSSS